MVKKTDPYLRSRAYDIIKNKIVRCELRPGSTLSEKDLMDEIGASRTPIREAISKLEEEHLVVVYPKRGIFVTEITIKDVIDIYAMRLVVEPYAVKMAVLMLAAEAVLPFKELWSQDHALLPPEEHVKADRDFHHLIARATGNKYLIQTFSTLYNQASRIRMISLLKMSRRQAETRSEHLSLIEAILERDEEEAEKCMKIHLTRARETALLVFPAL